jgi:hypothetical protein
MNERERIGGWLAELKLGLVLPLASGSRDDPNPTPTRAADTL